jgi:hypothetical protein
MARVRVHHNSLDIKFVPAIDDRWALGSGQSFADGLARNKAFPGRR